jgi:hypothetical protein
MSTKTTCRKTTCRKTKSYKCRKTKSYKCYNCKDMFHKKNVVRLYCIVTDCSCSKEGRVMTCPECSGEEKMCDRLDHIIEYICLNCLHDGDEPHSQCNTCKQVYYNMEESRICCSQNGTCRDCMRDKGYISTVCTLCDIIYCRRCQLDDNEGLDYDICLNVITRGKELIILKNSLL